MTQLSNEKYFVKNQEIKLKNLDEKYQISSRLFKASDDKLHQCELENLQKQKTTERMESRMKDLQNLVE